MIKGMHQQSYKITGMTCQGCANTVQKAISQVQGASNVKVDLALGLVHIESTVPVSNFEVASALASNPTYQVEGILKSKNQFWMDQSTWARSGFNTLNCLIGCSIGDFGMIIYLQAIHPSISMITQMILATIAGLITSVILETILLRVRENFNWPQAFQTALSMSFLSMLAMELAMNATDFMITGGQAAFSSPTYWLALIVAMVAGFLVPWPYNYYKLKRYNRACH